MKGIVLAGGSGSRMFPLTKVTNKHLLPVGKYPMVVHPIMKLKQAGIVEIQVITGREHMGDMLELLGSGASFGVEFTFRVQDEAGGIAQALSLAEHFAAGDNVCVILGDNIFSDPLEPHMSRYFSECGGNGAMVLLKEVPDPHRFGVAEISAGKITSITEKPEEPKTNLAVTGIYFYDASVFQIIKTLKPSKRGELEITDVNNAFLNDQRLMFGILDGWWSDAGTFESYPRANQLAAEINWNLPDLLPAPPPPAPKAPGYMDPNARVGWPPPFYGGYYPPMPGAPIPGAVMPGAPITGDALLTEEERKKVERRRLEREAAKLSMPKFKEPPKDHLPHDFDQETVASATGAAPPDLSAAADTADLIFMMGSEKGAPAPAEKRPEIYQKTCETLPDNDYTTIGPDGRRSNDWVPEKYYDYAHFPERVYKMNYDKFEHKLALATQVDKAIRGIEGVSRHYPEDDERQIRIGYYFHHKDKEYPLAFLVLGDSMPPQPHVQIWIKLDIYQEIENVGFAVHKFRLDNDEARLVMIDSIDQLQGLVDVLQHKIELRQGTAQLKAKEAARKETKDFGAGRSF